MLIMHAIMVRKVHRIIHGKNDAHLSVCGWQALRVVAARSSVLGSEVDVAARGEPVRTLRCMQEG